MAQRRPQRYRGSGGFHPLLDRSSKLSRKIAGDDPAALYDVLACEDIRHVVFGWL